MGKVRAALRAAPRPFDSASFWHLSLWLVPCHCIAPGWSEVPEAAGYRHKTSDCPDWKMGLE